MTEQQRRSTLTYAGHEYRLAAEQATKVIDAMSSPVPTRVSVEISEGRVLWMVIGPGVAVSVLEDSRPLSPTGRSGTIL